MKMEENVERLDEWSDNISSGGASNLAANDLENDVENSIFGNESYGSGKGKGGESIAERRARKCGFNASKISTPRFRSSTSLASPCSQSPCLMIPAGISPHLLLDSPILLPNSQLSPTTGTFAQSSFDRERQMMIPSSLPCDADYNCDDGLSSMFTAHTDISSVASFSDVQNQHLVAQVDYLPADCKIPVGQCNERSMNTCIAPPPPDRKFSDDTGTHALVSSQFPVKNETFTLNDSRTRYSLEEDQIDETYPTAGSARTTEDGFNWRKYGQKQVKGSDYPRSYYKCTHPNCQVKKKVERSLDGQITEIIYKNTHNHPKPQPCRRSPFGASPFNETSDAAGANTMSDVRRDWQAEGLERLSSASVVTEMSDLPASSERTSVGVFESAGTPEFSSTLANYDDEEEDAATQGNFLTGDDDEKEPDAKRRNIETTTVGSRAVRAPRVVVQIESEVDILDDGYRWRKYGQKVVKGNPNPRSYYKCTSAGCNVRKHVERASHDLKFVITTYEGKHNHEVPAARNSTHHANSGPGPRPNAGSSNLPLNRTPHLKPEPHVQDLPPPFDSRIGCNNDFLRSNFLGTGPPPFFRYPGLPNTSTPFNPYGFSSGLSGHHPGYATGVMPNMADLLMPLPVGFAHATPNYSNPERMISMYPGQQHQVEDSDVRPLRPKQEQGDESSLYGMEMQNVHYADSSSSMYNNNNNNVSGTFPS